MTVLDFRFHTRYGSAAVSRNDIISFEDVDGGMCVVTICHPNDDVHKLYSNEKAEVLLHRFNARTVINKDSEPVNIKIIT